MSRKVEMKLILGQQRRTVPNLTVRTPRSVSTNTNTNTSLQSRVPSLNRNAFRGNMNGVFDARGRPCG